MNVSAKLHHDGEGIIIHVGKRDSKLAVQALLDLEQADLLYTLLGNCLDSVSDEQYEDYLRRNGRTHDENLKLMTGQIDQGAEIIPLGGDTA